MGERFAFRTPVAIPEFGAYPGDWIEYNPRRPDAVYVIRAVSYRRAMDVFRGVRELTDSLPPDPHAKSEPRFRPMELV